MDRMQAMHARRAPALWTICAALIALFATAFVCWLALSQPWLGLDKAHGADGPGILLLGTDPAGRASEVPPTRLLAVEGAGGRIALTPFDAIDEPDVLPSLAAMDALYANQQAIWEALRAGPVTLVTEDGDFVVEAAPTRPFGSLPAIFWLQILVGAAPLVLGGWVLSLRRRDLSAWMFSLAGLGLAFSAMTAAWYSTRDLAVPGTGFYVASTLNLFGSLLFGACMSAMVMIYPVRLVPRWVVWSPLVIFGLWFLGSPLYLWPSRVEGAHLPTALEMLWITVGLLAQFWATRRRPKERAIVKWFGSSVLFGCGGFIALMAIPSALGYQPTIRQGHAFLLFLFVYLGLAIGVARYRMFDLGDWSFRLLFYAIGVAVLFAVDAALISVLSLEAVPAFSAALVLVVLIYLPLRDFLGRVVRRKPEAADLSDAVGGVALAPTPDMREARFRALLERAFNPLSIAPAPSDPTVPQLVGEGEALDMPAMPGIPALRMEWTGGGRKLFAPRDRDRAARIVETIARLDDLAQARDRAVEEERARIDRDVHDNIGVQLLGALHSVQPDRKDAMIRQTLADLRNIVANTRIEEASLRDTVADLRGEIGNLYDAAGVTLEWLDTGLPDAVIPAGLVAALRAILREATGNALRHSGADRVSVRIRHGLAGLEVSVTDTGHGIADDAVRGNGLDNLEQRASTLGGDVTVDSGTGGTRVLVRLPWSLDERLAEAGE